MPMVANHVEFVDGPCAGEIVPKASLTMIGDRRFVSITRWVGEELEWYELREDNKAYWVNIVKGLD